MAEINRLMDGRQSRYYYPLPSSDNPKPKYADTLPRLSRIKDMKNKPGLQKWYARKAANQAVPVCEAAMAYVAFCIENGQTAAEAIKAAQDTGIAPKAWTETRYTRHNQPYTKETGNHVWAGIENAYYQALSSAGREGTAVHKYAEIVYGEGQSRDEAVKILPDMSPEAKALIASGPERYFDPVDTFFDQKVDKVLYSEKAMYNPELKYAGTTDMILKMKDGSTVILDWKTGSAGNFMDVGFQLAGYALCPEIEPEPTKVDSNGKGELWDNPMIETPEIDYGICFHLLGDGTADAKKTDLYGSLREIFIGLVAVYYGDLANDGDKWHYEVETFGQEGEMS